MNNSPAQLLQVAVEKGADIAMLEKLMDMQERWNVGQAKMAFYESLSGFQSEMPTIEKKKSGHNYKYAPLSDIIEQVKSTLRKFGLSYRFEQSHDEGIEITCIVTHVLGHSEQTTMKAAADTSGSKNSVQAIASTVTYLSRYTFCGGLGISTADEDMDGRLPTPEFTQLQKDELDELLEKEDSMGYVVFAKTVGNEVMMSLNGSFKKGTISQNKAKMKKMELEGWSMFKACASDVGIAISKEDEMGIGEIIDDMTGVERKILSGLLDQDQINYLKKRSEL